MTDSAVQASDRKLTPEGLAMMAEADAGLVRQLIAAGAIHAGADGLVGLDDVPRVRFARVLVEGGVDLDGLMWAIRTGILPLDRFPEMWAAPEPGGRTYAEFAASLGPAAARLPAVYAAFGLAEPSVGTVMRQDEQETISDFLAVWAMVEDQSDVYVRAARIAGEGVRRIEVATYDLFDEFGGSPPQRARRGLSEDEALEPSMRLGALLPRLMVWLERRHAEHELFSRIVSFVEASLAGAGRMPARPDEPAAIAFVDLAGYTALTEQAGDERAARSALTLRDLAEDTARARRGQVVKLLGDGVLLRFASTTDAVIAVLTLMDEIDHAGLPHGRAGIAAGPVVVRDGDVYGHIVNLAARIAAHAGPGELLLARDAAERLPESLHWEDAGTASLKGIDKPIPIARARLGTTPRDGEGPERFGSLGSRPSEQGGPPER